MDIHKSCKATPCNATRDTHTKHQAPVRMHYTPCLVGLCLRTPPTDRFKATVSSPSLLKMLGMQRLNCRVIPFFKHRWLPQTRVSKVVPSQKGQESFAERQSRPLLDYRYWSPNTMCINCYGANKEVRCLPFPQPPRYKYTQIYYRETHLGHTQGIPFLEGLVKNNPPPPPPPPIQYRTRLYYRLQRPHHKSFQLN